MVNSDKTTNFGFQTILTAEKKEKITEVFHSVAPNYDVMNDLMSLGMHRIWKQQTVKICQARNGHRILDVAGGTGDLTARLSFCVGDAGKVILTDINSAMLQMGRDRLLDRGIIHNVDYVQADAESLPFTDNYFDRVVIGFGLRNVTEKMNALQSMYRVLKPGGFLLILEFSRPTIKLLEKIYDAYSFAVIPKLGNFIAKDEDSYRYLVESIRVHPDQETLLAMMRETGFEDCQYYNLSAGIVAIHRGYKY